MADILPFTGLTAVDETPESVLDKAKKWGMCECLIVGMNESGELQFGGSISDAGRILLLIEAAKQQIIRTVFD